MSFFEDSIKKATLPYLYTNKDIHSELWQYIQEETRVVDFKIRPPEEFCNINLKANIQKIKEINPKLIPKLLALVKSGVNPVGTTIDGVLITEDLFTLNVTPKELEGIGVSCDSDRYVAIDFRIGLQNIWDGLVAHFTREVNDFRKELGMTISERIHLSWHFDFNRHCNNNLGIDGNVLFGKVFRDRHEYIKGEVLAIDFFESVDLDYFLHKYEGSNIRWYEDGGIRIWKV